jgi:hypothetical protein
MTHEIDQPERRGGADRSPLAAWGGAKYLAYYSLLARGPDISIWVT